MIVALSGTVAAAAAGIVIVGMVLAAILAVRRIQELTQALDGTRLEPGEAGGRKVPGAGLVQKVVAFLVLARHRAQRFRERIGSLWDQIRMRWWYFEDRIWRLRDRIRRRWWR